MFHHRRSIFPLILGLLTALLFVFMIMQFRSSSSQPQAPSPPAEFAPLTAPSPAEYEAGLVTVLGEFFRRYDAADQDFLRAMAAEEALDALLNLRTPAEYRDLHLSAAMGLNQVKRGSLGEPSELEPGLRRLESLRAQYSWLP